MAQRSSGIFECGNYCSWKLLDVIDVDEKLFKMNAARMVQY